MFLFEEHNGKWFFVVFFFFFPKQRNIKYGLNLDWFSIYVMQKVCFQVP